MAEERIPQLIALAKTGSIGDPKTPCSTSLGAANCRKMNAIESANLPFCGASTNRFPRRSSNVESSFPTIPSKAVKKNLGGELSNEHIE